jgi:predicted MFS family arabinose efflux permease
VLPGFLENELDHPAKDLGILVSATAVTGLIVTVAVAGAANSKYAWGLMLAGAATLGVSMLLLAAAPNFGVAIIAMLLTGAGTGAFQLLNNALVMQESAPEYYGRVMSLTMMAWGVNGLVGLPFGLLADRSGERVTIFIMGIGVLVVTAGTMMVYSGLRNRRAVTPPLEPLTEAIAGD